MNRFARGHPLALELAAGAVRDDPELRVDVGPPPVVVGRLLDALVSDLPEDVLTTLEAVSTVRRVTEPILRAVLEREEVRQASTPSRAFPSWSAPATGSWCTTWYGRSWPRTSPCATRRPTPATAGEPGVTSRGGRGARAPAGFWELTADLIYLIRNPVLRSACFPAGSSEHTVEPAAAADGTAVFEISRAHEPAGPAALLERWRRPDRARVDGPPLGPSAPLRRPGARHAALARARERGDALARGRVVLARREARLHGAVTAPVAPLGHGRLRALSPIFGPLGFAPIGEPVDLDGTTQQPVWLDFGEGSVDGWLARLVDAELEADERDVVAGRGGGVDRLSARELEVLALIAQGLSNRTIGERLVISDKTAGHHVSNLFAKLGVHTRAEAARIAAEQGLTS